MRFHHNLLLAVTDALELIFNQDKYADKAIQKILKRDKRWGSRDRGFIAGTTYDIVRYKRLYSAIAGVNAPYKPDGLWRLTSVWIVLNGYPLPDWPEYADTPTRRIKGKFDKYRQERAVRESIPDWLDKIGLDIYGSSWESELKALNEPAPVVLRVNKLKTTPAKLQKTLQQEEIPVEISQDQPGALVLAERADVFKTKAFQDGLFEVQDTGSQAIAKFCEVKPGMRIADACAGAGGKTLHLATLMGNKGQIIAMDLYKFKLQELKRRARRNEIHNIETRVIEGTKTYKKLRGKMDRVLLDAPCSGLGVLRRNPDAKWKMNPERIQELIKQQSQILQDYAGLTAPGGKLIYATCSILPAENQERIQHFLTSDIGKAFTLEQEKTMTPARNGTDGFYMARMKRNPR